MVGAVMEWLAVGLLHVLLRLVYFVLKSIDLFDSKSDCAANLAWKIYYKWIKTAWLYFVCFCISSDQAAKIYYYSRVCCTISAQKRRKKIQKKCFQN